MYPTIEDLKTIAESGVYRRIPRCTRDLLRLLHPNRSNENAEGGQPPLLSFGKRRR